MIGSAARRSAGFRALVAGAIVAVAFLLWPAGAGATIARANLDGSGVQTISDLGGPRIAVGGGYVYWTAPYGFLSGSIERANLDGSGAQSFIADDGSFPWGMAVDAGRIYWADHLFRADGGVGISRANLDGSGVERRFIATDLAAPADVAVAGEHIYWTSGSGAIGRARLDGSVVEPAFITRTGDAERLAATSAYIYWTTDRGGAIWRARLDGSGVEPNFITGPMHGEVFIVAQGIDVDASHVYWTNSFTGHIGRARLDGSRVQEGFIRRAIEPVDLAVSGGQLYWTDRRRPDTTVTIAVRGTRLTLGRDRRTRVTLTCPSAEESPPCAGTLRLATANRVRYRGKQRRVTLAAARYSIAGWRGTRSVRLRLSERKARLVRRNPRARAVEARVRAADAAGNRTSVVKPMRLRVAR